MTMSYRVTGNVLNVISLFLATGYAGAVVYFLQDGKTGFLDNEWKKEGFCIHNKDIPSWSSFDTCFYMDTAFTVIMGILWFAWKNHSFMDRANKGLLGAVLGTFGHGLAHKFLALQFKTTETGETMAGVEATPLMAMGLFAFFWFPFLCGCFTDKVSLHRTSVLALIATYCQVALPGVQFTFVYIQTVLIMASVTVELLNTTEEKQAREYMSKVAYIVLPSVLVSYTEATSCTAWFKGIGGHVWYDASIAVGTLAFYLDAYFHHTAWKVKRLKTA